MDVVLVNGEVLRGCRSALRVSSERGGSLRQALRLAFIEDGRCHDTTLPIEAVRELRISSIGGRGAPRTVRVRPVPSLYREQAEALPTGLFELSALAGYAGPDDSQRSIGFESAYFGLALLWGGTIAQVFDNDFALAIAGEALLEGGRLRLPLMLHGRLTLSGSPRIERSARYEPSACVYYGDTADWRHLLEQGYELEPSYSVTDSSSYLVQSRELLQPGFRPFLFVEAGYVFDAGFDGSGRNPSVNAEDYNLPLLLSGGAGLPLWHWGTLSLAYRLMLLNLRTECPECPGKFVINNNDVHSAVLKIGWNL